MFRAISAAVAEIRLPLRPYDCRMWSALACVYENMKRFQDAIQCSNRALLGADPAQTCQILKTLAKLHDNLQNYRQAAEAHRKLIAIAESQGRNPGETAQSYLYAAEYELDMLYRKRDAKDLVEGFPFERQPRPTNGKGISMEDGEGVQGNLELAIAWLTKVKDSRAPEKEIAEENLRYITKRVQGGLMAPGAGS
jgi:anaphase-promoting complex subunit 8